MGLTSTTRRGKTYRYYLCGSAEKHGRDTCPIKSVPAGEIESAVLEQLKRIFALPEMTARTMRALRKEEKQQKAGLVRERQALEGKRKTLAKSIRNIALADSESPSDTLSSELSALGAELAEVEGQLRELDESIGVDYDSPFSERQVADALRNIAPVWDHLFPAEQERLAKLLIREVTLKPDGLTLRIYADGLHSLVAELNGRRNKEHDAEVQSEEALEEVAAL